MTFDENMYIPTAKVNNIPITVAEKRQPVLFSEEQLRKDLGDENFEQATEVIRELIDRTELTSTSPDGTEDGYYSEIRGMPEEEQNKFALETGLILKNNENILHMNDQQLRAIVYHTCKNQSQQYIQILNFESFATGCMEAVHDVQSQKPALEVGARIMSSLIMEQNIRREQDLRNDYQNIYEMGKMETDFIPIDEIEQNIANMDSEYYNEPLPPIPPEQENIPEINVPEMNREPAEWIRIQQLDNIFRNLILNIQQNPMPTDYFNSDMITVPERAVVDYSLQKGILIQQNNTFVLNENFTVQMQNALPAEARQFAEQNQEVIPVPMPEPAPVPDYQPDFDIPEYQNFDIPEYPPEPEPFYQPDIFEH